MVWATVIPSGKDSYAKFISLTKSRKSAAATHFTINFLFLSRAHTDRVMPNGQFSWIFIPDMLCWWTLWTSDCSVTLPVKLDTLNCEFSFSQCLLHLCEICNNLIKFSKKKKDCVCYSLSTVIVGIIYKKPENNFLNEGVRNDVV